MIFFPISLTLDFSDEKAFSPILITLFGIIIVLTFNIKSKDIEKNERS